MLQKATGGGALSGEGTLQGRTRKIVSWKAGIDVSLREAERQLLLHQSSDKREDKLAVLLLSNDADQLCCALGNFSGHLAPWTPIDFYVFSVENQMQDALKRCHLGINMTSVVFLRLHEHWETPEEAEDPSLWTAATQFSANYRRMGHWRLAFQMEFVARLGYNFVLQLDDDSAFTQPVADNLVVMMKSKNLSMAARNIIPGDPSDVTQGIAELAKFFLVTERVQPTTLFTACQPKNISGLYTSGLGGSKDGGYSTRYLFGNFVIIAVDFWYQEDVQRFVRLVMRTGAHFRYRWNEQQVQSLIWQLFVPSDNFYMFDFPYEHPVKPWHTC